MVSEKIRPASAPRRRVSIALFFFLFLPKFLPCQTIAAARAQAIGALVTVRGVVTNGAELGKIRYMQDGTAGIAAFPGAGSVAGFETAVKLGDSIEVKGALVDYNGLLEISPITAYKIIASNQPLPSPKPLLLSGLAEALEGQLVSIDCTSFMDAGSVFNSTGPFQVADPTGGSGQVYLRSGHPLIGTPVPLSPVRLVAILSQFNSYQLLPRTKADLAQPSCFAYLLQPEQSDIQTNGFYLHWKTSLASTAKIRYGNTPVFSQLVTVPGNTTDHFFQLTQLEPGTIYWVQVESERDGQTILSEIIPFATQASSSGQIKVYFNHDIDLTAANGLLPDGQSYQSVLTETIARIQAAQQTIDVAMYNNNRDDLTTALKAAHQRGVRVRYVGAFTGQNYALDPPPPFGYLFGNADALMHDKFMVIDAALPDKAWVMSGSMNWTNANMIDDFNNTLFIQDQSLARSYVLEFEEMFGSTGPWPNVANSRFGAAKRDNTPHQYIIGGRKVESYFSPSDRTTTWVTQSLKTAQSDLLFALYVFTKEEQAQAIVQAHSSGVQTRGMIESATDIGSEYDYLLSNFVSVKAHPQAGLLHHKYAVVDAGLPSSDPLVVTGSHNWTFTAETANDENTLIIHDANLATLFQAEFEKRWSENTSVTRAVHPLSAYTLTPNPSHTELFLHGPVRGHVRILDSAGREYLFEILHGSGTTRLELGALPMGPYFVVIQTPDGLSTLPFQKN